MLWLTGSQAVNPPFHSLTSTKFSLYQRYFNIVPNFWCNKHMYGRSKWFNGLCFSHIVSCSSGRCRQYWIRENDRACSWALAFMDVDQFYLSLVLCLWETQLNIWHTFQGFSSLTELDFHPFPCILKLPRSWNSSWFCVQILWKKRVIFCTDFSELLSGEIVF